MNALVLVGHGSQLHPGSARPVFEHADAIRERGYFDEVREAFWKEEPSLREVLRTVGSDEAFVVPVLMSEGYFAEEVFPRELRITDGRDPDVDAAVHYTDPVGTHDRMTDVIVARAESAVSRSEAAEDVGVAVVGHGTERNENSARSTRRHAANVRKTARFDEVRPLFLDEQPFVDDVTDHFESEVIVVVPLFLSDGHHTTADIPDAIGLSGASGDNDARSGRVDGHRIRYTGAVGTEPLLVDVVVERAVEAGANLMTDASAARSETADATREAVLDAFLERAADGISADGLEVARCPDGFTFHTSTRSETGLSATELRAAAAHQFGAVSNWFYWDRVVADSPAHRAFLRWAERADDAPVPERYAALAGEGITRTWGELAITSTVSDLGERAYDVRHRADHDASTAELDAHADPAAARDISRFDDTGRFRPLKTAPSLPTGWALVDLNWRELVRAVDFVYPATIANWHRENAGRLDVTHFRDAVARQTGIYEAVDELAGDDLACAAEACCNECVKRRVWDERADDELPVDRGDGELPCREPCSFFVAAAREFLLEEERDRDCESRIRSVRAGLPPLPELADAAETAEPSVRTGDFEHPANPYRIRYRRAKRRNGVDSVLPTNETMQPPTETN